MPDGKKRAAEEDEDVTVPEPKRVERESGPKCSASGCIGYVAHNLFLGSMFSRVPDLLKEQGITHVLMFGIPGDEEMYEKIDKLEGLNCRFVAFSDEDSTGTAMQNEARRMYEKHCQDFLTEGTTGKNRALVHCERGRARSVIILAMHLVVAHKLTVMEALLLLLTARYDLLPQDSFITALRTIEQDRIKGTDEKESFIDTNLPGETCRPDFEKGIPKSLVDLNKMNAEFARTHKSKIAHLKGEVGMPNDAPDSLYAQHRFKKYLSWAEIP